MMFTFYAALALFLHVSTNAVRATTCPRGTFFHEVDYSESFCVDCLNGTFMPWTNHTAKKCFECTKIENASVEILITPCDKSHQANIQCVDGYYRRRAKNPRDKDLCIKCTESCPEHFYPVFPCQNFTDLKCCPGENFDSHPPVNDFRECRERPWMCRRGQYLDTRLNDCRPCPENTFMSEDYHSHIKCWDCHRPLEEALPLHTVMTQPCTSVQPSRYACEEGFYVNHGMSYRGDDIGCSPCQTCGDVGMYIGLQCDTYRDTVCCEQPNMTVVDGPQGSQCLEIKSCKYGIYNPPTCDKNCSQHCGISERPNKSLCDQVNGTCLFGCVEGYTGSKCETLKDEVMLEDRNDTGAVVAAVCTFIFIVVLVIIVTIIRIRRKKELIFRSTWWERCVGWTPEKADQSLLASVTTDGETNLSDEIKNKLREAVGGLKQMKDLPTNKDMVEYLKTISQAFWDHFDLKTELGDFLAELNVPETCIKIERECLTLRKNIQDNNEWAVIDYAYRVSRDLSTASPNFARKAAEAGGVKLTIDILTDDYYIGNLEGERESQVVGAFIFGVRCLTLYAGNVHEFRDKKSEIVQALKHLISLNNDRITPAAKNVLDAMLVEELKDM